MLREKKGCLMYLDTKTKDVSVWLVKFPPLLVKLFEKYTEDLEIGYIEIIKPDNSNNNSSAQLRIFLSICDVEFNVQWNEMTQNMYVLKGDTRIREDDQEHDIKKVDANRSNSANKNVKLEGRVSKEVFISPEFNEKYFEFKKKQGVGQEKRSSVKIIDYATKIRPEKYTTISEMDALSRRRKKMLQQNKRERLERSEVMDIVFRAFEIQDQWTVKDLGDYSGQPNAYILEILQEIGELDKGDFRGSWSLKEEYTNKKESEY